MQQVGLSSKQLEVILFCCFGWGSVSTRDVMEIVDITEHFSFCFKQVTKEKEESEKEKAR